MWALVSTLVALAGLLIVCDAATPAAQARARSTAEAHGINAAVPRAPAILNIQPSHQTVSAGSTFSASVIVSNVTDLGAFQFALNYSPTLISSLGGTPGNFPGSTGRTIYVPVSAPLISVSKLIYGAYTTGAMSGANGAGTLATFSLRAQSGGTVLLHLSGASGYPLEVTDTFGDRLEIAVQDASVDILPTTYLPLMRR
jgi:hypothetical protein